MSCRKNSRDFSLLVVVIFLSALLSLGVFLRFVNLDQKIYGFDETFTLLRAGGYTEHEMQQALVTNRSVTTQDLLKYQTIHNNRPLWNTIESLAKEEPHFPPAYFLVLRYWSKIFGESLESIRSLSVWLGILALPCAYWLCVELFSLPLAGLLAMVLLAISPFHILYSQEARPYSLWTTLILASTASLLRAIKIPKKRNWLLYVILLSFSLYSYLYSVFLIFSHSIYLLIVQKEINFKTTVKSYLIAAGTASLIFLIWPCFIFFNRPDTTHVSGFFDNSATRFHLINRWVSNLTRVFFDIGDYKNSPRDILATLPIFIITLSIVFFSFYFIFRKTKREIWGMVFSLIIPQVVFQMLPDFILGRWRLSGEARYLIQIYLATEISVAYLMSQKLLNNKCQIKQIWKGLIIFTLCIGASSCLNRINSVVSWSNGLGQSYIDMAYFANRSESSLIISDDRFPNSLLAVSHLVDAKVRFILIKSGDQIASIPEDNKEFFLFNPSENLLNSLASRRNFNITKISSDHQIFRFIRD